jgi:hypothetical protein
MHRFAAEPGKRADILQRIEIQYVITVLTILNRSG